VTEQSSTTTIRVGGDAPYDVLVGRGLVSGLPGLLPPQAKKVLIVHAPTLGRKANEVRETLVEAGYEALIAEVPDAEDAKRVKSA
jgi:3-dehydroquinate synthase